MEADWAFEIGGDAPVIDALWSGFVDLRAEPEKASCLLECTELASLAEVLVRLNSAASPAWTSKADVFVPDHIDPDELDAHRNEAVHSLACYIDVLMRSDRLWNTPSDAEKSCRQICERLQTVALRNCRIDLVVRRALVAEADDLGLTVYFTACGRVTAEAKNRLSACLEAFADILLRP